MDVLDPNVRNKAAIQQALKQASSRLWWRVALRGLAASIWLPLLAAAAWVLLVRFTFLNLPQWTIALFFFVWLVVYGAWLVRLRITPSQCAHYLDAKLALDERVTTYLELEGRARLGPMSPMTATFRTLLASDTAMALVQGGRTLPARLRYAPEKRHIVAFALAMLALLGAMNVPTQLDAIKQEQNVVREALDAQAQKLADLKAEIVARPDLSADFKQDVVDELDALQQKLLAEQTDREEALATIADAEEKLRGLAPFASTDFEQITLASDLLKSAVGEVSNAINAATGEESDLSSAESAIKSLKPALDDLTHIQARALASDLERAANAAAPKDPQLAQNLQDAAAAIRTGDWQKAASALDAASRRFAEAAAQQQTAEAVENTLAKLEDGRQSIAEAGASAEQKRDQVGFRRNANNDGQPATPADGSSAQGAGSGDPASATQSPNGAGQRIGQNQPAFGQNGNTNGSGGQGGPSGQDGQSGQSGQGGQANGSGQQSGGGGGSGSASQGGDLGRVNGPVRVTAGSQSSGGGAAGNGVSAPSGQSNQAGQPNNQSSERVYVPGRDDSAGGGGAGQAAPEQASGGASGRAGDGPSGETSQAAPGLGAIVTVNTPYTEVLGEYSQQAIEALDRAYVPPDAKKYVRDYFTALGR